MSHSHFIKSNQDHKSNKPQTIEKEIEHNVSNSKKEQVFSMIPVSGPGKHMGHIDSIENNIFLNNLKASELEHPKLIINSNIPPIAFKPLLDCKKCFGTGYIEKTGNYRICKNCAEKEGKCVKCGGSGMKVGGKNCDRCMKL